MTVADIVDFTCHTVGDTSSDMQDFARKAIRLKYQTLYDAHAWRESKRHIDLVLDPALNGTFFIPLDAEEVVFVSLSRDQVNYQRLVYRERDWFERISGGNYAVTPYWVPIFYRLENFGWPYLAPGKFTITTSELSSIPVHIEGLDSNGYGIQDDFLLSATKTPAGVIVPSSVQTVNTYDKALMFSKGQGTISVFADNPFGAQLAQIPYQVTQLIYSQFRIYPNPIQIDPVTQVYSPCYLKAEVKLKADVLNNDMSVPRISHVWDALVEFTLSALYTRARQLSKADSREQKAIAHVQAAVQVEKNQSEFHQQVVPDRYETGDYLQTGVIPTSSYPWG